MHWRVNSTSGESGEEEADGRGCGLVDVVNSLTYRSMSSANLGICSWKKMENKSSLTSHWIV